MAGKLLEPIGGAVGKMDQIDAIISTLKRLPSSDLLLNHYVDRLPKLSDPPTEDSLNGPQIREDNLRVYLREMLRRKPRFLWLFEAPSARGAVRTGVPQIGESSLLARGQQLGVDFRRATTTRFPLMQDSDTSKFVWSHVDDGCVPLFWNSIMWRPHALRQLTETREPSRDELKLGAIILDVVVRVFAPITVIAVGRPAEKVTKICGLEAPYVRHPSMGGRSAFSNGIRLYSCTETTCPTE